MEINTDELLVEGLKGILPKSTLQKPICNGNGNICFSEEDILDEVENDFGYQIKDRGKSYYEDGNIIQCCKTDNKYYAKVRGSNDSFYTVSVKIDEEGIEYNCSCPCTFPCKHEYAVLIAISNQEYESVELKEEIKEKKNTLQNVLQEIPAEEIKNYLLSPKGLDCVCFEMNSFEEHFRKYYPNQSYEYYYNNLFNALVLNSEYSEMVVTYMNKVKQYISNKEFHESYKIIKSIIEAYNDTNKLNFDDYIIDYFPALGMLLRVVFRKSDESLQNEIKTWLLDLESNQYYNSFYLEDIILMIHP